MEKKKDYHKRTGKETQWDGSQSELKVREKVLHVFRKRRKKKREGGPNLTGGEEDGQRRGGRRGFG